MIASRGLAMLMLISGVLDMLAYGGSRWVTWPERTAQRLVEAIAKGERNPMLLFDEPNARSGTPSRQPLQLSDVKPEPRSLADLLMARRRYQVQHSRPWNFTAERGLVFGPMAMDIAIQRCSISGFRTRPDDAPSDIERYLIKESLKQANRSDFRAASSADPAASVAAR